MRILSVLWVVAAAIAGDAIHARAADSPSFEASVDRAAISQDESVALRFKVVTSGMGGSSEPEFEAPDFDVVNQYSSVFVESFYENGKFGARNNRQFTQVLRPKRTGDLVISGIRLKLEGRVIEHPPLKVRVTAAGSGTPPPPGYGGSGAGLRGAGKRPRGAGIPFIVRAEVDHAKVYKGQRVVVSYYLYQRVRVNNLQVDKFPVFDGFLREDLELPILGQRLGGAESVVLDGVSYDRLLLARYAAYPLKEGRLSIDSMAIKANYYARSGGVGDEQDPVENLFQNFMQQLEPRTWSNRSDPVQVEVQPLPLEGRPASFTGGVGDFEVTSVVDKSSVRVNEPVTLVVKVEGRGNVGAIGQPPVKWPEDLEVYETKSRVTGSPGGVSAKIFETLLIPRKAGRFTVPEQELGYFSPPEGRYRVKKAAAIDLVAEGQGGEAPAPAQPAGPQGTLAQKGDGDGLLLPEQWPTGRGSSSLITVRIIQALVALGGVLLAGLGLRRLWRMRHLLGTLRSLRGRSPVDARVEAWRALRALAARPEATTWADVVVFYQRASDLLCSELEAVFGLPARAWSRAELRRRIEEGDGHATVALDSTLWQRIENILEYGEAVQFSGGPGEHGARSRMDGTLREIERIVAALGVKSGEKA